MIYENVLKAMGHTPLIKLNNIVPDNCAQIFVKFEGVNIGGSTKTRTAYQMIHQAEKDGKLNKDSIIVEPTSGNQGIGIALVGAVLGYKTKIIMPDSVSKERRALISQYGAKVVLVHDDGNIGKCIKTCIDIAKQMQKENENVFVPQQFTNPANIDAHKNSTGAEIIEDMKKANFSIDGFCSGIGTGGTITGIGNKLKDHYPNIEIWATEPEHAAILSGKKVSTHLQMGIGDGLIPDILDQEIYSKIYIVTDEQAIKTSRQLASKEGLLCGITSGTNVFTAIELGKKLGPDKNVVTILPDTGERYITTTLFEK